MANYVEYVYCPITDNYIDIGLCQDIQFVVDDMVVEEILEPDLSFKLTEEHKRVCKDCKKRIDPRL